MKTIKTYIQARRHEFSNNRGGFGLLGGGGWLLELFDGGVGLGVVSIIGSWSHGGVGLGVVSIIGSWSRQVVIAKQIDILYAGFFWWWWNYASIDFRRTIFWFLENYNIMYKCK